MVGEEHMTKAAFSAGAFIIFTSTSWLWNIVKDQSHLLLNFILSFPRENVSEDEPENKMLVMGLMQKQELSKAILQLAVTLCFGLYEMRRKDEMHFIEQLVVAAIMMGVSLICNAILVLECTPTFARYAELLGVGLVISAFYLLFAIPLMWWLRIILALCWVFCIRPFIMAGVFANMKTMAAAKTSTIMHAGATEGVIII